jgi:hypothetical protein
MQIGGTKRKALKPTQPMFVVQKSGIANEYMKLVYEAGSINIEWVGDPNAATQFTSKYAAKVRIRELADVPETRCFKELV